MISAISIIIPDILAQSKAPSLLIIAITGMPGAGKSTAAEALVGLGLRRIVMGDVVREETKRRGLAPDPKNTGMVMRELRAKYGNGAIAELCLKSISGLGEDVMIIDGIRSMAEVGVFRNANKVMLLAIHASRKRRFQLLKGRGRSDDPLDFETFVSRDNRELEVGMGDAIALADEVISNEHSTPDALRAKATEIAKNWMTSVGN